MIELNKKTQQDFLIDTIKSLESLGFEDITKEHPIHFIEQLPVTFENIYSLQKRLIRNHNDITTSILIGKEYNQIHVIGESYYKGCSRRFFLQELKDCALQHLLEYIQKNEVIIIKEGDDYDRIK